MSTSTAFPSSINTQLNKSDPVAPPSPSKSPIGVGAPGSQAKTTTPLSPSSNLGFGSTAGFGGLGGLGGLTKTSTTSNNSKSSSGLSTGLNSAAAIFSTTNGETKSVSSAANAPIFKPSGQSDLFRRVNASLSGTRFKLSLRVDQPVESVTTRTTAYIRGLGPVESESATWNWQRSSLSVACMNQACPYNNGTATVECVCFNKTHRFCTPHCLKMSWKSMQSTSTPNSISKVEKKKQKKNEGKDNEEIVLESDQDVEDRILAGDSIVFPESKWGQDMTFDSVANTRTYLPTSDDVGRLLRLSVDVAEQNIKKAVETEMVIPMPAPPPDRRVLMNPNPPPRQQILGNESIRVVTYNLLAAIYATSTQYPYCPAWALTWNFRKGQILRELAGYGADVLCLQEVQADHFESFLYPQLAAMGYEGLYKQKTREALGPRGRIDGCALFFKVAKFELKEKYVIEFNEAAMTMAQQGTFKGITAEEAKNPQQSRNTSKTHGLSRLLKDNVAQIAVLELRDPYGQYSYLEHPPRICVSNVHLFWDPAFADIKLWQAHILIKELQKFTQARGLPLVLGGDFNSEPKSSVHDLLGTASVRPNHPDLQKDVVGILPSTNKLTHTLPLRSAYAVVRGGQEPPFTNYTGHYVGTLDYIWFTADRLVPMAVLDTYTKEEMEATLVASGGNLALPAPQFPSDHLSLCCDFALLDPRGAGGR